MHKRSPLTNYSTLCGMDKHLWGFVRRPSISPRRSNTTSCAQLGINANVPNIHRCCRRSSLHSHKVPPKQAINQKRKNTMTVDIVTEALRMTQMANLRLSFHL